MEPFRVVDIAEVEPSGPGGAVRFVRRALDARAFGINQLDLLAGFAGPQHDEVESAQEEVYVVLAGSGTLALDGEHVELRPGRFVRVAPSVSRQLAAGPDGLTIVAIGAPLGAATSLAGRSRVPSGSSRPFRTVWMLRPRGRAGRQPSS